MDQEVHIAGIVIFTRPPSANAVASSIRAIPAATVHASSADGKLIVTLETGSAGRMLDYMDALRALPCVVTVALVYQHAEPLAALEQEMEP